ncbi:tumor necrosis factor receptor superfamily member 6-like isoform X4 [Lethenteron reissneri]|uniref:tumor necrosis factor receptor superfamily member 6-like isoform X4 n=1 Tax=Lethenteron reissneri TaxID=7753 RepID=UPI002AB737B1|nr:tumor necrosis factor receptor superfamily member 6-like isoform X4 [Lethenteron reissneri]
MNLPSCFIAVQSFATLILSSESATISIGLQEVNKGGCDATTHYLSTRGICCELCQAGSKKVMDCESNTSGTFCTACRAGRGYMDEPNSSTECKKCTVCNVNFEKTESRCTAREDTRCRCKDGFQRAASTDPCTDVKKEAESAMDTFPGTLVDLSSVLSLVLSCSSV